MANVQHLVGLLSVFGRSPEPPSADAAAVGYAAYLEGYKAYLGTFEACRRDRAECLEVLKKAGLRAVAEVGDVVLDGASVAAGYAETVLEEKPAAVAGAKSLYVDGKAFAEVVGGCAASPVACAQRGRHWLRNKAKREKRAAKKRGSVVAGEDDLRSSLVARRVVENQVAAEKAKAQLSAMRDPAVVRAQAEALKKEAFARASSAVVKAQAAFCDLASVSPGSSASQQDVRDMRNSMNEALVRMSMLEEKLLQCSPGDLAEVNRVAPFNEEGFERSAKSASVDDFVGDICEALPEFAELAPGREMFEDGIY